MRTCWVCGKTGQPSADHSGQLVCMTCEVSWIPYLSSGLFYPPELWYPVVIYAKAP